MNPHTQAIPRPHSHLHAPHYRGLADDLVQRIARVEPAATAASLLEVGAIARPYRVPAATAQFVLRAAHTRLRPRALHSPLVLRAAAAPPTAVPGQGPVEPADAPAPARGEGTAHAAAHTAVYRTVAHDLRNRIEHGEIEATLPSRQRLTTEYGVSHHTIRRAVELLAAQAILDPHGAAGTPVRGSARGSGAGQAAQDRQPQVPTPHRVGRTP